MTSGISAVSTSGLLGAWGWFEDFSVGLKMRHARAATISEVEGAFIAKQAMNTAQGHWNDHILVVEEFGRGRLVFGLATASMVFGLASQDTTEHAIAELGCDKLRFRAPVHHGDTVEAFTEVLAVDDATDRADAGIVRFKHWGRRQDKTIVFEGERVVLVKRKSHWSTR
jgi:acyl dehydratase